MNRGMHPQLMTFRNKSRARITNNETPFYCTVCPAGGQELVYPHPRRLRAVLYFLGDSKASDPRERPRKLPPARKCDARTEASRFLAEKNVRAPPRGPLALLSLRKVRDCS